MKSKNNIQLGDLVKLEGLEKPEGKEVVAEIAVAGEAGLGSLAGRIEDSEDVKLGEVGGVVEDLRGALAGVERVNYFGDELTMEQYRAIGNLAENTEICRQLANGIDKAKGGKIEVSRLRYLPHGLAGAASKYIGTSILYLNGLAEIDLELARELGKHYWGLSMCGLSAITPEIARALTFKTYGYLTLDGLLNPSKEVVEELVKYQGSGLSLYGLSSIDAEMAKLLAGFAGVLYLRNVKEISLEVAREFGAGKVTGLALSGVEEMSADVIRELVKGKNSIDIGGLTDVSDEAALELAKYKYSLSGRPEVMHKVHRFKEALNSLSG